MNRTKLNPLAHTISLVMGSLLLTACATAQQAVAPQAAAAPAQTSASQAHTGPQWEPSQLVKPQFPALTTPEQIQVRDRATARWQALLAGDFAKAYTFITPALKKSTTEAVYVAGLGKTQWHGAEVLTATCATPEKCVARVRVDLKVVLPRTTLNKITTHVDEAWVLDEGQWWLSDDIPR